SRTRYYGCSQRPLLLLIQLLFGLLFVVLFTFELLIALLFIVLKIVWVTDEDAWVTACPKLVAKSPEMMSPMPLSCRLLAVSATSAPPLRPTSPLRARRKAAVLPGGNAKGCEGDPPAHGTEMANPGVFVVSDTPFRPVTVSSAP